MISIFLGSFFVPLNLKEMFFFNSFFYAEKNIFLLLFVFMPVFLLLTEISFKSSSKFLGRFYYVAYSCVIFFLFGCFCSCSSLLFLIFLEMTVIFMVVSVLNLSKDYDKSSSVSFMFLTNSLGAVPFMMFLGASTDKMLPSFLDWGSFSPLCLFVSFSLILGSKVPIFFLHFWLTKAHVSASGSGSMILASLLLKIGAVGFYKFCPFFSFFSPRYLQNFFVVLGTLSCVLIGVFMFRFFDVKYVVACSSVAHMAMMMPSFLSGSVPGCAGSCLMMASHGLVSCFIFFLVSIIYEISMSRSLDSFKSVESYGKNFMFMLFFFFLLNLGFPPFAGFLSEFLFLSFLSLFSFIPSLIFIFSLVLSGKVFILISSNLLFSKTSAPLTGGVSCASVFLGLCYLFYYFFLPLI